MTRRSGMNERMAEDELTVIYVCKMKMSMRSDGCGKELNLD
jgi:hypothetical protein